MSESHGTKKGGDRSRRNPKISDTPSRKRGASARPISEPSPESPVGPDERLAKVSGLAAVSALFRQDPGRAVRLYYSEGMKTSAGPFCAKMAEMRRVYRMVSDEELVRVAGTVHHGGIVAAAQTRPVPALDLDAAERWARRGEPLVVLDGVGNPHNLGAIARTLAFFGIPRLLISAHPAQAGLSDAAYRVAEGGLEYLEIFEAAHLPTALRQLREFYRVTGTALRGARPLAFLPADPRPICLVLGNEEQGLAPETLRACEALVTIPGSGAVQSLNVSAAAAILVSQIMRHAPAARRRVSERPHRPRPKPTRKR